ncbi:MAG: hypothetical protein HY854_01590 [Burkholderiales bacterium]|nr:hypothetical protein [Burkholderiales bacterium]
MNATRLAGIVLIVASVIALVYGGFGYTTETQHAKLGPIELSVQEKKSVNVPVWAGIVGIAAGVALLLYGSKKG